MEAASKCFHGIFQRMNTMSVLSMHREDSMPPIQIRSTHELQLGHLWPVLVTRISQ